MMDYSLWINKAIMKIGELKAGTTFVLKDLFTGLEQNELNRGQKTNLGRKFKDEVDHNIIPEVAVIDSPKGTSTTYKKTKEK